MANLKRLWDTENKKTVWAIPTTEPYKKLQVWTNDDGSKLYVYRNSQYIELDTLNAMVSEYGHYWKELNDEMVGYYLTPEPTNLYNWDEGDEVSYIFKDWDGTVLKSGKIAEGQTPTAPADPTREATAQYTYTFAGWNPTVGPISKRTVYTAQYEASPRNYTVTIGVSPEGAGTVDTQQVTVAYGTEISYTSNVLMIGTNEITATAETGYEFSGWGTLPATVTETLTITATFQAEGYILTFTPRDEYNNTQGGGSLSSDSYTVTQDGLYLWNNTSYDENLYIVTDPEGPEGGETVYFVTPTPDSGYQFGNGWCYYDETESDWIAIEDEGILITGSMQIRYNFYNNAN